MNSVTIKQEVEIEVELADLVEAFAHGDERGQGDFFRGLPMAKGRGRDDG